ncbi:MAG: hypothetical protein M1833_000410 [Piccolia ochrophora]|nr:MAG: hypothetical protein M1833_000410 [Piccolia ochrophora]
MLVHLLLSVLLETRGVAGIPPPTSRTHVNPSPVQLAKRVTDIPRIRADLQWGAQMMDEELPPTRVTFTQGGNPILPADPVYHQRRKLARGFWVGLLRSVQSWNAMEIAHVPRDFETPPVNDFRFTMLWDDRSTYVLRWRIMAEIALKMDNILTDDGYVSDGQVVIFVYGDETFPAVTLRVNYVEGTERSTHRSKNPFATARSSLGRTIARIRDRYGRPSGGEYYEPIPEGPR